MSCSFLVLMPVRPQQTLDGRPAFSLYVCCTDRADADRLSQGVGHRPPAATWPPPALGLVRRAVRADRGPSPTGVMAQTGGFAIRVASAVLAAQGGVLGVFRPTPTVVAGARGSCGSCGSAA